MHTADASLKVADHQICVLYDSSNGKIMSIYQTITLEGAGPAPRAKELEERARTASAKIVEASTGKRLDAKKLKALMVGPEAFKKQEPKKVDLKRREIVADKS